MAHISSLKLLLTILVTAQATNTRLKEIFAWKQMDFVFPSEEVKEEALKNNDYIPGNNLPLGLEVSNKKLFITVPRWKTGVASSLNYINLTNWKENKSPALIPYPSWEANQLPSDDVQNKSTHIISTFRVRADICKRLWVMDSGLADALGNAKRHTPPKVMVYDLNTDTLLRTYELKSSDLKENSFFANIVLDETPGNCDKIHAYIPDLGSYGLIVYNWETNESWRVEHHYFHFDPLAGNYHVGGVNFQWQDGIFGISLSSPGKDGYRTLYFHPFSSTMEFSVSTEIVQNSSIASDSYYAYKVLGSRGNNSQATASFLHEKTGVMFYTLPNRNAIGCWNTNKPFSEENQGIVADDDVTLIFPNDLKVCRGDYLWVLSDRLPTFVYRELDSDEINYRVFNAPVTDAVKGTVCE